MRRNQRSEIGRRQHTGNVMISRLPAYAVLKKCQERHYFAFPAFYTYGDSRRFTSRGGPTIHAWYGVDVTGKEKGKMTEHTQFNTARPPDEETGAKIYAVRSHLSSRARTLHPLSKRLSDASA
ncbi:MAG: hypothetical protein ACR2JC_04500 [Chloroflexota bacterium]|nr:MAG: hypothetical protein DLM70_04245 [Chloroflexota bacterium]